MSGGGLMSEQKARAVRRTADGGIAIETGGAEEMRLRPGGDGWMVESAGDLDGWRLARSGSGAAGFILTRGDGSGEEGRTMLAASGERGPELRYLLTSRGALYRIRLRGPRESRYELQSWEAPGAYLTARPGGDGWVISPEPAAAGLREMRPLLILFAAEILDAEEPLATG